MASSTSILLPLSLLLLLSSTALSQSCKSLKFKTPNKSSFSTCTDLPHLSASLHYTFNSSTSTLSMAYTAAPAKPSGWIAWAINPNSLTMVGSQALLAYKSSNGSISVSTYDLQSYSEINQGPISYKVSGLAGEASGEMMTIFGTWRLPAKTESINQVWQVGPSVSNGRPDKHDLVPANLAAKGSLDLTAVAGSPAEASTGSGAPAPAPNSGKNGAGVVTRVGAWFGFVIVAFVLIVLG